MSFAQDVKKELTVSPIANPEANSELIALIIHIIDKQLVLELKT